MFDRSLQSADDEPKRAGRGHNGMSAQPPRASLDPTNASHRRCRAYSNVDERRDAQANTGNAEGSHGSLDFDSLELGFDSDGLASDGFDSDGESEVFSLFSAPLAERVGRAESVL